MIDMDKLRQLLAAATPGPWRQGAVETDRVFVPEPNAIGGMERVLLRMNVYEPYVATAAGDVALICALVNAAPHLLAVFEAACMFADIEVAINARPGHVAWSSLMAAVDAARGDQ